MNRLVRISAGDTEVDACLNESDTATGVLNILPITGTVNLWGEEMYFSIPLAEKQAEDAREVVAVGDIAYWPQGQALCIFLGRTPASQGDEPRAISPVNVIGQVEADGAARLLGAVKQGDSITIRR